MTVDLKHPDLAHLLRWVQDGVIARHQLLAVGATDKDIGRMLKRRDLTVAHHGVYVDHTGPLTFTQREWVAVLAAHPAALSGRSALPGRRPQRIEVAVEHGRKVTVPDGVRLRRVSRLAEKVVRRGRPPRMTIEHAVLLAAADELANNDVAAAFRVLADTCWSNQTWPEAIRHVLTTYPRITGRRIIDDLLRDLADGANSVLERGYLRLVERPHGLPRGERQVPRDATGRRTYKDVEYRAYGLIVELQGRAYHDNAAAYDADARRDLAERAVGDRDSLRITYGLVFREPCATAARVAQVLQRKGWAGSMTCCPGCPPPSATH